MVHNGQPTASLALIDALTADRDALAREVAALREREQLYLIALVAHTQGYDAAGHERLRTFEALVERAPDGIVIATIDGQITYANPAFQTMTGHGAAVVGMHLNDLIAPEERRFVPAVIQRLIQAGTWQGTRTYLRRDGSTFEANLSLVVVYDAEGQPQLRAAIIRDLTRQRRLEQEQLLLQEQVIATQQSQLRDLRTPLLRLAPEVVVMPLAGTIDAERADAIFEVLLGAIARQPASTAIIDLSEQAALDGSVARLIVRAAHALRLLGLEVVVTGVQPAFTGALDELGLDKLGVTLHANLHDGVDSVLRKPRP
jgi:PAS domain S-box-containing protein